MSGEGSSCSGASHRVSVLFFFAVTTILPLKTGDAINPGCQCIRFRSTFGKEWGQFSSPDYPGGTTSATSPGGIPCLLYSFRGPVHTIVEVRLERLQLPTNNGKADGGNGGDGCSNSYLKLFLHLEKEETGVSEVTPWNRLLCGIQTNLTFFSAANQLVIQFHTSPQPPQGQSTFIGYFRFLNSSQYESNGRLVGGTKCDFLFESTNYSSPEGRFFSPNYPSSYPHNAMCAYIFRAKEGERVQVTFETVNLEPERFSCLNKTDVIRVHDGHGPRSPVIALLCNPTSDFQVVSSGPELLIQFIANSGNPGSGFRAKFHFIKVIYENPYDPSGFNLQHYFPKLDKDPATTDQQSHPLGEDGAPQASTLVPKCDSVIRSDSGISGSLTSPNYPQAYPPLSRCRIDLLGWGRQRVTLAFVDFHLYHTSLNDKNEDVEDGEGEEHKTNVFFTTQERTAKNSRCNFSDTLSAFVYLKGVRRKVLEWCGPHPPPNLMSSDHRLSLEFEAKASSSPRAFRGFYAQYTFVEDFGQSLLLDEVGMTATSAGHAKKGTQLPDYPCAFVYNISEGLNGSLASPNYPGLYPRDTECHYFFHGDSAHSLNLLFTRFDIPAMNPRKCEDEYVEYSEYMPTDRRFERLCGHQKDDSFVLQSDSSFFRLGFRSGDGLGRGGGFGFQVVFTFTSHRINQMRGKVLRNNGHSQSEHEKSSRGLFFCVSLVITNLCGYLLLLT